MSALAILMSGCTLEWSVVRLKNLSNRECQIIVLMNFWKFYNNIFECLQISHDIFIYFGLCDNLVRLLTWLKKKQIRNDHMCYKYNQIPWILHVPWISASKLKHCFTIQEMLPIKI